MLHLSSTVFKSVETRSPYIECWVLIMYFAYADIVDRALEAVIREKIIRKTRGRGRRAEERYRERRREASSKT